jgi:hypothetical protein
MSRTPSLRHPLSQAPPLSGTPCAFGPTSAARLSDAVICLGVVGGVGRVCLAGRGVGGGVVRVVLRRRRGLIREAGGQRLGLASGSGGCADECHVTSTVDAAMCAAWVEMHVHMYVPRVATECRAQRAIESRHVSGAKRRDAEARIVAFPVVVYGSVDARAMMGAGMRLTSSCSISF